MHVSLLVIFFSTALPKDHQHRAQSHQGKQKNPESYNYVCLLTGMRCTQISSPSSSFVEITSITFGFYMDHEKRPAKEPCVFSKPHAFAELATRGKEMQNPEQQG